MSWDDVRRRESHGDIAQVKTTTVMLWGLISGVFPSKIYQRWCHPDFLQKKESGPYRFEFDFQGAEQMDTEKSTDQTNLNSGGCNNIRWITDLWNGLEIGLNGEKKVNKTMNVFFLIICSGIMMLCVTSVQSLEFLGTGKRSWHIPFTIYGMCQG